MEVTKESGELSGSVVPATPVKPQKPLRFYVRRNKLQDVDVGLANSSQESNVCESELNSKVKMELGDCGFVTTKEKESEESQVSQGVHENEKEEKNSKEPEEEKVTDDGFANSSQGSNACESALNSKVEVLELADIGFVITKESDESQGLHGKEERNSQEKPEEKIIDDDGFAISSQESTTCESANPKVKVDLVKNCYFPGDSGFVITKDSDVSQGIHGKEGNNSKEESDEKHVNSEIPQSANKSTSTANKGNGKKPNAKPRRQRFSRPRILEEGKKPRNPTTTRMRTASKKRKKENDDEEEDIVEPPVTPEKKHKKHKQSQPKKERPKKEGLAKRRKTENGLAKRTKKEGTTTSVARTLIFSEVSCLDLSRDSGPKFVITRRRIATRRRYDFQSLIAPSFPMPIWKKKAPSFPLPIWKKKSRRSNGRKNVNIWARSATELLEESLSLVITHQQDNRLSSHVDVSLQSEVLSSSVLEDTMPLMTRHQKNNGVSSHAHVSLHIEDTIMKPPLYVAPRLELLPSKLVKEDTIIKPALYVAPSLELLPSKLVKEDTIIKPALYVAPRLELLQSKLVKETTEITKTLVEHISHQKATCLSSVGNFPTLQTKDTSMEGVISQFSSVYYDSSQNKEVIPKPFISVVPNLQNKITKDIAEHLMKQIIYKKDHNLESIADVPSHMEEAGFDDVPPIKKAMFIAKLVKEMKRLKINKRVTTLSKKKEKLNVKVDFDPETIKEWELLMVNDLPNRSYADKETESKWKEIREIFQRQINHFISEMHLLQGDRKFQQWKGSVVDSVVGVFLTQNVSDYLSSNAFLSVAAEFPIVATKCFDGPQCYIEEPLDVDTTYSESPSLSEGSILEVEAHEKVEQRKNPKTGIIEDATVDWKSLRSTYTKDTPRDKMYMDAVDWNAARLSGENVFASIIEKRGQHNELARKILKFLNNETKENGSIDLEWLRDAPSDLVKRYLLEIEGIGLKSAECVRLLGLKHSAFPVDTNVCRIAVRLGWVPLEPLPNGVQMHQLLEYPSPDLIQKYLWPRLCKLPQETLYELHYQMITFGKVFCTKVLPNCNACPVKLKCKYFASLYNSNSSQNLLGGVPEEQTDDSYTFSSSSVPNATPTINLIEECVSCESSGQINDCQQIVESPSSPVVGSVPVMEILEQADIEDTPGRIDIPDIDINNDVMKEIVDDAFLRGGKMMDSYDEKVSKEIMVRPPENACIPMDIKKMKYYNRLRTEHVVFVLPDDHKLLENFEKREPGDPSPYLLAIWQPGETSCSTTKPIKMCNSNGSNLCEKETCSFCRNIEDQKFNRHRGTILIPCRTATRGAFPLNGTYFQTNEVFADDETSTNPRVFPRHWCDELEPRPLYCGTSVSAIFRFLDTIRVRLCFSMGFLCMRGFDRKSRCPMKLVKRLHSPTVHVKREGKKKEGN